MQAYITNIIINDRREKSIQLLTSKNVHNNQFIIECAANVPFPIVSLSTKYLIKALALEQHDLNIADLKIECLLSGDLLKIKLTTVDTKEIIVNKEETMDNIPVSYEDLDHFKAQSVQKKEQIPQQQHSFANEHIGLFADCIALQIQKWTNGDFHIQGSIHSNYEYLLQSDFPNLKIELILEINKVIYTHDLTISFAHKEQFVGIALDFGSESSQMAIKRYDIGMGLVAQKPTIENLFKNIHAFHKSQNWITSDEQQHYYQEEKNTNFYKSIFFLKEDLSGMYDNIYKELFVKDIPHNLKMLVNTNDGFTTLTSQKYHQLPNLKITHKYDELFAGINFNVEKEGYPINISLGVMKNKVYNSILKVMIHSYLKKEFIISYNSSKKIRFVLLVPNIYDHNDIIQTQNLLHDIFQSLSENEYKDQLLAWEIITISESDASFLGYINKNNAQIAPNKDYIIIDSGKGTTDLSVIKTGSENIFNVKPIYRNGFAGAGNLVSFAIFETLIHFLRAQANNKNAIQKFIKENILNTLSSNDLEQKNKFYQEIERLKFSYVNHTAYAMQQWKNAKVGDITFQNISEIGANLSALTDLLRQIDCISDFYGYVNDTCELIAQRTVSYIKLVQQNSSDFNCGGIILTGRAFLFQPLEQKVKNFIGQQLNLSEQLINTLNGTELKDVCIKGVFNQSVRINSEMIGYPIQYITAPKLASIETATASDQSDKKKVSFQQRMLSVFFNELKAIENSEVVIATDQNLSKNNLHNSQILIGSKRYKLNSSHIYEYEKSSNANLDIIYTPNGYIVRGKEGNTVKSIFELSEIFDGEDIELNMVIPSLFPNYIQENYLYSYKRSDDDFLNTAQDNVANNNSHTEQSTKNEIPSNSIDNPKPKGPIYF